MQQASPASLQPSAWEQCPTGPLSGCHCSSYPLQQAQRAACWSPASHTQLQQCMAGTAAPQAAAAAPVAPGGAAGLVHNHLKVMQNQRIRNKQLLGSTADPKPDVRIGPCSVGMAAIAAALQAAPIRRTLQPEQMTHPPGILRVFGAGRQQQGQ